jgi:hypothetical protein
MKKCAVFEVELKTYEKILEIFSRTAFFSWSAFSVVFFGGWPRAINAVGGNPGKCRSLHPKTAELCGFFIFGAGFF